MSQYGDIIPVPGTSSVAEIKPSEILASYAKFTQRGVTIAKVGAGGVIPAGTVLGRVTASKKYVAYADGASDGSQVAKGILREAVDTSTGDRMGNIVISGILKYSKIVGRDAAADTDLKARIDTDMDTYSF